MRKAVTYAKQIYQIVSVYRYFNGDMKDSTFLLEILLDIDDTNAIYTCIIKMG